jgi:hypothetical protein
MSKYLKLEGPSEVRIRLDPAQLATRRAAEIDHLAYHIARLLRGEATAVMEWECLGLTVAASATREHPVNESPVSPVS